MKEKKDAYQLYNLKLKKEENEILNFILRRNAERKALLEELERENAKELSYYGQMKDKKTISPQMILASKTINEKEKEKKLQQIQNIEYELKIVKTEFLKIKNKQEELQKRSDDAKKKKEQASERKETNRAIEEGKVKKGTLLNEEEGNL